MNDAPFEIDISRRIWANRYRYSSNGIHHDHSVKDSWRRVADAIASQEPQECAAWADRYYAVLSDFRFLPGGRILAGAGTGFDSTLFNCFVMGRIEDSMEAICDGLKEGALTMQRGGGVGYDFSTLRPAGSRAHGVGSVASGPVSFMRVWDSLCATLTSTGLRRGAMMATLRCDHPDIMAFIDAKRDSQVLRNFNLSVLVTDDFIEAVKRDTLWPLVFPDHGRPGSAGQAILSRRWSGTDQATPCVIHREVSARELWQRIMRAAYDTAEPGVLFIDRINRQNNLYYREDISATNPCGEIPLPPYGACNLGSINLTRFVLSPFQENASLDFQALDTTVSLAVRLLDRVIDLFTLATARPGCASPGIAAYWSGYHRPGGLFDHAGPALWRVCGAATGSPGDAPHLRRRL